MERAAAVIFTSQDECCVFVSGTAFRVAPGEPLIIPVSRSGEMVFTLWSINDGANAAIPVPVLHRIAFGKDSAASASLAIVDWQDVIEVELVPAYALSQTAQTPFSLDKTEYFYGEQRAAAELYRDGGLRLALTPRGGETFSLSLGAGSDGRLSVVDAGSSRLLTVSAVHGKKQRLILLNSKAETVFDAEADEAHIEDGCIALITNLGTVKGHSRKERYTYSNAGTRLISSEIGFFTSTGISPGTEAEKALSVVQEIRLGIYDGREFLADELASSVGADSLREYFGEYDGERIYPAEEQTGKATVGLTSGNGRIVTPRRLVFEFSEGLITDIREL